MDTELNFHLVVEELIDVKIRLSFVFGFRLCFGFIFCCKIPSL